MIWFKIKKLLRLYKEDSSVWIKIIQTDDVEYIYEVKFKDIDDEIKRMKPLVKEIKIL